MIRLEDARLLTGKGRFTDNLVPAGTARGHVLRSPHAHALIRRIDAAAARRLPGVLAVLTGEDQAADGIQPIRCPATVAAADRSDYVDPPRFPLAVGRVRHVGDAVAFVVAETVEAARDAAEAIEVDYDPLPAVIGPEASAAPGAPLVWDQAAGNTCATYRKGDTAAVDAAFAKAAHVTRLRVLNNRLVVTSMEARNALGAFDAASGRYTLTTSSQGVHFLRKILKDVLGVPAEALRVLTFDVGGGFGMKFQAYPEQALVLWAARKLGRPVHWSSDRSEAFLSDTHARAHVSEGELALDRDGSILAYRARSLADTGAYLSSYAPSIPTLGFAKVMTGPYLVPAAALEVRVVFTHTVPVDAYRGAGKPEAQYLLERLIDVVGGGGGLSHPPTPPRRNMLKPADLPWQNFYGVTYDAGDFSAVLDRALTLADRAGFAGRRADSAKRGLRRGFGLSAYVHGTGGDPSERGAVAIDAAGRVTLKSGTQSQGQGHETAFASVVAAALGLDPGGMTLIQGDSDALDRGGGTGGSSSLLLGASALGQAAMVLIDKGRAVAAEALEAAPADLDFQAGEYRVAGTDRRIGLTDVARRAGGLDADALFQWNHVTFPNGVQACEVEVDPETGRIGLVRYVSVDDFGREITPNLVDGQVIGGIVQGIGQALMEGAVFDAESGQLLTGSLTDYQLPRADDLGPFVLERAPTPTKTNPAGAKGVGECGTIGAPPCVVSAICDALGIAHLDMPATPEKVWRAAQGKR